MANPDPFAQPVQWHQQTASAWLPSADTEAAQAELARRSRMAEEDLAAARAEIARRKKPKGAPRIPYYSAHKDPKRAAAATKKAEKYGPAAVLGTAALLSGVGAPGALGAGAGALGAGIRSAAPWIGRRLLDAGRGGLTTYVTEKALGQDPTLKSVGGGALAGLLGLPYARRLGKGSALQGAVRILLGGR